MNDQQAQEWAQKEIALDDVSKKVTNGNTVYIGSTAATAQAALGALVKSYLQDIQILQMIPGGSLPHLTEHVDQFRTRSFFSFTKTTYSVSASGGKETMADYTPMAISAIPRLLRENILTVDVALIKVSEPHKGYVSLGMGVEFTQEFIQHAKIVIAEVSPHIPWTEGPSKVPVQNINWWVRHDEPLMTTMELWPDFTNRPGYSQQVLDDVGRNILKHIPDGATLKFGLSPISFTVFPFLNQRRDLGIHTDVFTESLYKLQLEGVITNAKKTIDQGFSVASQAHGSRELYSFIDRNPAIEFHPLSYVSDPEVMAKLDNFVAVIGALKIDVTGQVATESIATKIYGGIWSDSDSVAGARLSKGGKSIVALPSKSLHGRSNVVIALPPGTGVAITRADVEYVVTEYGTAYLYGKSIRERCLALIDIAHPDFRQELLAQAKENHYISTFQPGLSFQNQYPQHLECVHTTKTGRQVFCRPIKAIDEDKLRSFFHKLSDHSVYFRYFRKVKSMPQRVLQKTSDIDYSKNMTFVILFPPNAANQELIGIAQWIFDKQDNMYEISFQVQDSWQGEGLGSFLFAQLLNTSEEFGIRQFKADVLADNKAMNHIFSKSGVPFQRKSDFGVITYIFDLPSFHDCKSG